jgi:catechol 2,3-dioxygenase-like lactoylglutathione lyase family enzyme
VDADNARSKRHVAFEVEDLDAWRREFMTRGISVDDGRPAPDVRRFFVRDPSGNRLEFYELV